MNSNDLRHCMGAPGEEEVFLSLEDDVSEEAPLIAVPASVLELSLIHI